MKLDDVLTGVVYVDTNIWVYVPANRLRQPGQDQAVSGTGNPGGDRSFR